MNSTAPGYMAFYHLTLCVLDEDYFRKDTGSLNYGFMNSCFKTCVYANRHLLPLKQLKYLIAIVIVIFVLFLALLDNVL